MSFKVFKPKKNEVFQTPRERCPYVDASKHQSIKTPDPKTEGETGKMEPQNVQKCGL